MGIVAKHFLGDLSDKEKNVGEQVTNIFIFPKEITLVDTLCSLISEKIKSEVYWYTSDENSIICVMNEQADNAIKYGKNIIIDKTDNMSINYIINDQIIPVLYEYSVIATIETDNFQGLRNWIEKLDPDKELLVKTSDKDHICILSKEPDDFTGIIKKACIVNPLGGAHSFDFTYIKL